MPDCISGDSQNHPFGHVLQKHLLRTYFQQRTWMLIQWNFIFASCFLRSHFLLVTKKIESWQNSCSYKKGSLGRDKPCIRDLTWQAAYALVGLASLSSTSWRGLPYQQSDWAPFWLGACARVPGDCSWSLWGRGPNSAASFTLGSLMGFFAVNDWHLAMRLLVIGGPWKACLQPHKIGQSPTRSVLEQIPQLVGILVELPSRGRGLNSKCRGPLGVPGAKKEEQGNRCRVF